MTDLEPTALEERVARHLAANDWIIDKGATSPWENRSAEFRNDYVAYAREVLAIAQAGLIADRVAVLREAADALDVDMERFFGEWPDEPRNSPYALGRKDAADELRRLAAEAQPSEVEAAATHARDCLDRPAVIRWCADRVRSTDGDYAIQAAAEYLDDLASEAEEVAEATQPKTQTTPDAVAAIVDALTKRAGELSEQAEEEMRRDLEEQAQVWHEAAELVRRLKRKHTRSASGDGLDRDAEIRTLTSQRDRYHSAWYSARERAQAYREGILRHVADRDFWKQQVEAQES